ncbi:MAG: rRNA maturation RNase YbeY, partial [Dehalococcoidia bacterium]|nr:rRNA maturation RNase YbeY [Dehalococcoidia bacterium]
RWEIGIQIDKQFFDRVDETWVLGVVTQVLSAGDVAAGAEVSLVVTGDEEVRELNRTYRGFDEPTDVLSFAMSEEAEGQAGEAPIPFVLPPDLCQMGDVVISYESAERQARERGVAVKSELALLIVHGVLHLLSYDHAEQAEERVMRAKEQAVLSQI